MNSERKYLQIVSAILEEIKLRSLGLPKKQPPQPRGQIYSVVKPHGVEFWLTPRNDFQLVRNIIYKLEEEKVIKILDESVGDLSYEGNRFIVQLGPSFETVYNQHKKGETISKRLENEKYWFVVNFQGKEIHFFVGDKESNKGRHVHLILDEAGILKVDKKDQPPSDLVKKVVAITMKNGKKVKASLEFAPDPGGSVDQKK